MPNLVSIGLLLLLCCPGHITAAADSPADVIRQINQLQHAHCDLACNVEIASLYSDAFIERLRSAIMPALENQATRREMMLQFFGETFDIRRLQAMAPEEFFGRQLWQVRKSSPPEYIMRSVRVVSMETETDGRVRAVVMLGGMQADPDYEEEGQLVFVETADGWKIDVQH